jgi:hypothetical protein
MSDIAGGLSMDDIFWETDVPHSDNTETMRDYLDNINMLDIIMVDGAYAEGRNGTGKKFAISASGNGDFCHHKVEFGLIED